MPQPLGGADVVLVAGEADDVAGLRPAPRLRLGRYGHDRCGDGLGEGYCGHVGLLRRYGRDGGSRTG
ncbi:hypothetical protein GCM10019017_06990 [Streptomyces showdoensis]